MRVDAGELKTFCYQSITVKKKKNYHSPPTLLKSLFLECFKSINIISPLNTSVKSVLFFGRYSFIK